MTPVSFVMTPYFTTPGIVLNNAAHRDEGLATRGNTLGL